MGVSGRLKWNQFGLIQGRLRPRPPCPLPTSRTRAGRCGRRGADALKTLAEHDPTEAVQDYGGAFVLRNPTISFVSCGPTPDEGANMSVPCMSECSSTR